MYNHLNYQRNPDFPKRYISPEKLFSYLQTNYSDQILMVGTSTLELPIYKMSLGTGAVRVLAWSQMHGNESNSTHAMLDLLASLTAEQYEEMFSRISLDFIFMLNPDGAAAWTRRNALEIDLNRDFHQEASKELPYLKKLAAEGYDYALNLHEQRTIFTSDDMHPAMLAFLAPSESPRREITDTRKKAMAVISEIYRELRTELPGEIARYSDEFYPNSVGDNFTALGLPTILFEGGHSLGDYQRYRTRKYYTVALHIALRAMAELKGSSADWKLYNGIPVNRESHYDIIYRNVKLNTSHPCVLDVAVQYREIFENEDISFVPIVTEVGDLSRKKGWEEIDCTGKKFVSQKLYPKLDEEVNFYFE